jgi:putative peptidoglycan lipid II flippase
MSPTNATNPGYVPRTVAVMMVIMFVGKAMGVLRDIMQGRYLGADTAEGIAFMQASTLPRHFFDILFASAFTASFIPVFNQYLETKGKKEAVALASLFISVVTALTAAVTVACVVFTVPVYDLAVGSGALAPETRLLGIRLLRMMFPLMLISGVAFSLTGVLQSLGEFRIPAAMSVASNGIILLYYLLFFDRFGVVGLCVAFLIGWGSQALIQIPFLVKNKIRLRFRFNLKDPGLRQIGALALPVMAASWVGPVNLIVNGKAVLVSGGPYDYTAVNFAYVLFSIIGGVFVLSVANVIFPALSRKAAAGDGEGFRQTLMDTLRSLFFFLLPMSFGLMALSTPLVRFLFFGGLFTLSAVEVTGGALFYFSLGMVGYGLQIVLSRACYARRDGRTPMVAALTAIALNAALSFLLAPGMGANGVALASSVSASVGALMMLVVFARRRYILFTKDWLADTGKMLALSFLMFAAVAICVKLTHVFAAAALSAAVYLGGGRLLGLKEMRNVKRLFKGY